MGGFVCFHMSNLSNYIGTCGSVNILDHEIKSPGPNLQLEGNWWFVESTKAGRKTSYTEQSEASDQKK